MSIIWTIWVIAIDPRKGSRLCNQLYRDRCSPSVQPASTSQNLLTFNAAHASIGECSFRVASRHHDRLRRVLRRAETCRGRQELPPSQQARHEVQRSNAADERGSGNFCMVLLSSDIPTKEDADQFLRRLQRTGWSVEARPRRLCRWRNSTSSIDRDRKKTMKLHCVHRC